ncbi:MAG: hypothetical protein ACRDTF_25520 [Pseudonocardiaceae bacterium]
MISRGTPARRISTVQQISYALGCEQLRRILRPVLASGREGDGGVLGVEQRACAGLFALLLDHPVDRRGRCRSCRRPGAVFGRRWRRCGVHRTAGHWLQEPHVGVLLRTLAHELDAPVPPPPISADPDTDALPRIAADPTGPRGTHHQSPVISPPPSPPSGDAPRAEWPDPDHGGARPTPHRPRPRRDPPDDQPSGAERPVPVGGSALYPPGTPSVIFRSPIVCHRSQLVGH